MPSFTKRNGALRTRSRAMAGRRGGLRTWRQCNRGQQNECSEGRSSLRYAVRSMLGVGRRLRSAAGSSLTPALLLVVALGPPVGAHAGDRTNLPLKNWGGFSLYQDAVYDDLERLVTAGLADRTILNTKPISRVDAARTVARAIQRIRRDEVDALNLPPDLEPRPGRLVEEFQ